MHPIPYPDVTGSDRKQTFKLFFFSHAVCMYCNSVTFVPPKIHFPKFFPISASGVFFFFLKMEIKNVCLWYEKKIIVFGKLISNFVILNADWCITIQACSGSAQPLHGRDHQHWLQYYGMIRHLKNVFFFFYVVHTLSQKQFVVVVVSKLWKSSFIFVNTLALLILLFNLLTFVV